MAEVRAFRGIRFNSEQLGRDLSAVVCPPFDVISLELQRELYARHSRNMIRLELPQPVVGDDVTARYQRAAAHYAGWLADGTLVQDAAPTVYGYSCQFSVEGATYERRGLIGLLRLEPWENGVVRPHERTLPGPIQDRMHLMRACRANFSPIWLVYSGAAEATRAIWQAWEGQEPALTGLEDNGIRHALWLCTAGPLLADLQAAFSKLTVYIADGHHRYTTALALRDELLPPGGEPHPNAAPNFVLAHLAPSTDPGLRILGIHRLVRSDPGSDWSRLRAALSRWFDLDETERSPADLLGALQSSPRTGPAFAVWVPRLGMTAVARLREPAVAVDLAGDRSAAWRRLDAVALHALAIDSSFDGGTEALLETGRLTYAYNLREVERGLETGQADVAFFLRETPIEHIMAVADAGDRMPEKSTFFYPKPVTGAVIASLQGEVPDPGQNL